MRGRAVRWRARALTDLAGHHARLSDIANANPNQTISRLRAAANSMERLGDIGRPGAVEGTRELSVRHAPYVIVYRMQGDEIDTLAVYHTAQDR